MVYDVIVKKLKLVDVAKRHHRSQAYISTLVKRASLNEDYLQDLIAVQDEKISKADTVRRVIRELLEESAFIKSSEMVCKEVKSRTGLEVKERYVLE